VLEMFQYKAVSQIGIHEFNNAQDKMLLEDWEPVGELSVRIMQSTVPSVVLYTQQYKRFHIVLNGKNTPKVLDR